MRSDKAGAPERISLQGYGEYILATPAALAASPEVQKLVREAKTQLVGLFGVTATRDTSTAEPLMWGDEDGDCLTPEIALQERFAKLIREAEARGMERAAEMMRKPGDIWRTCTTTGGPSNDGQKWVHMYDFNELLRRADAIRTAAATHREGK